MEESAYFFEVLAGLLYALVGGRLWLRARNTGEVMARIIGATFLLWGLSYLLYNLPFAISTQMLVPPLFFMGRVAYDLGALAIAVFTCRVFRAGAGWARAVLALMLLSIL
ncbi:MAG: hypothetical protein OEM49_13105, partial [Myxococcales bacterium]|nr:hypothetical protein [Myxococcales bacterium]